MAYEMVMPYHLHMPSYFLETFTEYPGINLLTEQRPYVYFSADNLIAATDTTHLYIYSPHDRQEFKYKKQGNALQLVTGEDSTFYVMKKYCFSTLQSAEYLVKEHKTVNKATGQ